ncbi:MAG: glycosyltransferase [Syntrophorhabdales bacterium]|jgi:glycosyltransferase involved in cell wall biosynthesis/peptidoglycan/xylan/chitin deacetylase (PgdA/CDA1 family)
MPSNLAMAFNNFYYHARPYIPRSFQIAVRRAIVNHKRALYADTWPINPKAATPPPGWQGWPDGKRFAFVITHDVETVKGVEQCPQLADMDRGYGFRSSFNFVAEDYEIPKGLREGLIRDGFEIGLHGLTHGGNLYGSRKKFEADSLRINRHLEEWNLSGFRTPSMFHNLDWMKSLRMLYDSSTFDTDPFEPQSDGLGTIFPRWVSANGTGNGYVELPYTLPQDFTLFVIMGQKEIDIWKAKLDWIAAAGGMALLLAHPDYMSFDGRTARLKYPSDYYTRFLEYVKGKYEGQYWHVLPRDIAGFRRNAASRHSPDPGREIFTLQPLTRAQPATPDRRPRRVCMLSYSFYDVDARVSRYAETLARRGDHVDIIALGQEGQADFARINGVNVFRIQKRERNEKGKMSFLLRLSKFFVKSSVFLSRKHRIEPYDLIHVHSVPDFEVFAAWLPKLTGAKVILDIHDIVPEFYAAKFGTGKDSFLYKMLVRVERLSVRFADHVIISNHLWRERLLRSAHNGKCSVVMNYPDPNVFFPRSRTRNDDRFIMAYPGTLNRHQGIDIAIRAFASVKDRIPHAEFHIYGRGDMKASLCSMSEELGLRGRVVLHDMLPKEEIAEIMANSDLGIVPKRNDSFGGEAFSTKSLEFMLLGVPLLISGTKIDRHYFNDSVVRFFEPEDEESLATAMVELVRDESLRRRLVERASAFVARKYDWEKQKERYFDLVDGISIS